MAIGGILNQLMVLSREQCIITLCRVDGIQDSMMSSDGKLWQASGKTAS
jgi:hypothetical protein